MQAGIHGLHKMAAMMLSSPEVELSDVESAALAQAVANVGRYYSPMKTSGKTAAWASLAVTAGMIYGPRVIAASRRRASASRSAPAQPLGGI